MKEKEWWKIEHTFIILFRRYFTFLSIHSKTTNNRKEQETPSYSMNIPSYEANFHGLRREQKTLRIREATKWLKENQKKENFIQYTQKERKGCIATIFSNCFSRSSCTTTVPFAPRFYIKEEKKPLSSRRVKRLFSNLLADIGFITSLSFVSTLFPSPPRHSNVVSCAFHSSSLSASPYCHRGKTVASPRGRVMACKRLSTHIHTYINTRKHTTQLDRVFSPTGNTKLLEYGARALFNL